MEREVLSTLIDTVSYGSRWLFLQFDKTQVEEIADEYPSETAVRILLSGGVVEFIDDWAEDSNEVYSEKGYFECDASIYPITLADIEDGIERIKSGAWNYYDDEQKSMVESDLRELMLGEGACLDIDMAEWLMQVILFNEIIY